MNHLLLDEEDFKFNCKYRKKSKNTNNKWSFITLLVLVTF